MMLSKNMIELNEVKIRPNSQLSAYSLGIISKPVKTPTQYERQLLTAGDFKPIHLLGLLAGSLQVDPILNAINGKTKRLKKYIQIEKQQRHQEYLEKNFQDFLSEKLKITEEHFGSFVIYLCKDKNIVDLIEMKNFAELEFRITDKWYEFKRVQLDKSPNNEVEMMQ